jgi:hypothetical protein
VINSIGPEGYPTHCQMGGNLTTLPLPAISRRPGAHLDIPPCLVSSRLCPGPLIRPRYSTANLRRRPPGPA